MFNSLTSTHGPATAVASLSSMSMSSQIQDQGVSALFQPLQREGTGRAVATDPENELMNVEEERVHQWASSPIRRSERTTHLPTPQSPNSIGTYVDASSFDTPTRTISRNARMSVSIARTEMNETASTEALTSLITPESSPLFIRRPKSSLTSSSSSLPSTPTRKTQTLSVTESYSALAGPSRPSTPSTPLSANMSIPSVLSSPFVDRVEKLSSNKLSSLRSPGSDVRSSSSPQAPLPSTPPPNLQAPVPQRAAGGEITRLRLQQAAEQAALLQETESRRPEYLKRLKRPSPEVEEDVIVADQENTAPGLGLGVVDSPVKGRRIALFQETSEESFEQSLLAGGYPSYGLTPAYGEPSTPQHTKSTLSQRAFDWLQQATPGQPPHPSTPGMNMKEDSEVVETEQESRKRRRLNAFRDHNAPPNDVRPKLYVVEVEGHGRVLIDHAPENLPLQHTTETPTKKRGNGRRKRGGGVQDSASHLSPSRKRPNLSLLDSYNDTVEAGRPNWLDQAFPWSMRLHEREELAHREEELKLKWVERYLERDSDEGDDDEDQSLGLPVEDFVEPPPRGGRGKMVPLPAYPANSNANSRQSPSRRNDTVYYPSDPADARAALLSKRSVRALAYRRMREEEAVCVCRGKDDGRELVQCDDCKEWFHLECIGVTDISDLGREEDPWYCRRCLGIPPARSSSPIFAPTDDRPATRPVRDPLFYQGNSQESPSTLPWHVPRIPKTPSRTLDIPQLSSRGSWDDSSSPVGPQTPSMSHRNVRSYTYETPKARDDFFDPLATPSRGMHFSGPFTTPRPSAFWATRASALQTPSRPTKRPSAPWAFDAPRGEDPFDSSPSRPTYAYDDSPVRRSQPRPETHVRVPESPSPSPLLGLGKRSAAVDRTHSQNALG